MPEVKVGIPSVVHAALLPRLIGQAHATALLLCCDNIDATQARPGAWCMSAARWVSWTPPCSAALTR